MLGREGRCPFPVGVGHRAHLQSREVGHGAGQEGGEASRAHDPEPDGARHVWSSLATPILESAMP